MQVAQAQWVKKRHLSFMDMSIVASPLVLWSLCIKQHTGFPTLLQQDKSNSMFVLLVKQPCHQTTQLVWTNCACSLGLVTLPEATDCLFWCFCCSQHWRCKTQCLSSFNTALSSQHLHVKLNSLLESVAFPWLHILSVQCLACAQCSCGSSLVLDLCKYLTLRESKNDTWVFWT